MHINIKETFDISRGSIIDLYKTNGWSSVEKPDLLYQALMNSHTLVSAWAGEQLVGIGNAISDGYLVVYYPLSSILHTAIFKLFAGTAGAGAVAANTATFFKGLSQPPDHVLVIYLAQHTVKFRMLLFE